ncbi:protein phosphatase 2C domain-containing protein [Streptomyces paradoxus]|uniref:protein phosphatase 2C domain-containing protein n=1 Tax=Streptomyces paradoxus TaxID=66375 RepID=UPI00362EB16A
MSQQGGRPTGHEDDWWRELYDDSTDDTGPTPARDSLDDRFASASGAVGDGAEERTGSPDRPEGRPFDAEPMVPAPRTGADDVRDMPRPNGRPPQRAPWEPPAARPTGPVSFPTTAKPPGHTGQPPGRTPRDGRPGDAAPPTGPRTPPDASPHAADSGGPSDAVTGGGPSASPGPRGPSDGRPGVASRSAADSGGPSDAERGGGPSASAVPPAPSDAPLGAARPPAAAPSRSSGAWPGDVPPPSAGPPTPPASPGQPPAPVMSGSRPATVPPPPTAPPAWPAPAADPPGNPTAPAPAAEPGGPASPAAGLGKAPYPPPADRPAVPPRPAAPPASSPPADQPPRPPGPGIEPSNRADRTPEPPGTPDTDPPPDRPGSRIERPAPTPRPRDHVGTRPPTYDAEPTALPAADPDDLDDLVADTVLDGARYGACTLRAVSVRGDSARYRGEPRRDALLTARFGTGEHALLLVAMATGARATPGAHRAAAEACHWIGRAVGRSHARLVEDIRDGRRGDLKSGLHRLTDRSLGKLRASASEQGVDPGEYAASLRCLLLSADPECRTRVFFGVGPGGLFRLREGEWQDIEPQVAEVKGEPVLGFGSPPSETPEGDRLTMDLGIPTPPSPYEPAPEPPREPFRFRTSVARPGDTLLMCSGGLADPLRGEPELGEYLAERWSRPDPPGLAAFLADSQVRVKGYADDRTAAAVWEA